MNDTDRLREHYDAQSDEDLIRSLSHGRSGYSSAEVWHIVKEAAAARGLAIPDEPVMPERALVSGAPKLFDGQLSCTGCLSITKMIVIGITGLNVVALLMVLFTSGLAQIPPILLSNLVVLGLIWLVVSSLYSRALRRAAAGNVRASAGAAAKQVPDSISRPKTITQGVGEATNPASSAVEGSSEPRGHTGARNDSQSVGAPMFYPNRPQWIVIWLTAVVALVLWITSTYSYASQMSRTVIGVIVIGALLVWQFAKPNRR